MATTDISEKGLETIIVDYLRDVNKYEQGVSEDYNKEFALDTARLERFLCETQPKKVQNTMCFANEFTKRKFFKKLADEITKNGVTYMLRNGFRFLTELFDLYYPLPSELNESAKIAYGKNIFSVVRQLYYSADNSNSMDVALFLNGMPIITMELKNHYTGQNVDNAVRQYQTDRDPKDLLFRPKRCAVHFAVDDTDIKMCSMLCGKDSWFLPFNKGYNGGAGNPVNPNGLKTAYLWEHILTKPILSTILENYAQVIIETKKQKNKKTGKKEDVKKEKVIWPRYHQFDLVSKLLAETKQHGVGQRFLIQHSAGSGKSNSITWLAYQLVGLLNGTQPVLDSVIVVTDRVNLDRQIKDNIMAFKKLGNIVAWAESADELRQHLQAGKKIIITIVHKFPFILDAIGSELKNKRFGIIIDEAHSSQNGSLSAKMNIALSGNVTDEDEDLEDKIEKILRGRKMVGNANYYAFTATPKNKTLQMFGTPFAQPEGETGYRPFHEYTMRQAIEEGFIRDVLENYTPYQSFYKVVKSVMDDPEFEKKQAEKKIRAYVERQPETIAAKSAIIVQHFHEQVIDKGKVGGQARAMVVTSSIIRAIEFYYEIKRLLEERHSPFKAIVAFSGEKEYKGKMVTESSINGFPSSEIEDKMEEDPYRILVVADKFQTGYDQPLLHTMYVDKVLSDVKAVQTLSRLNRCHPKKRDTFVLDFAGNEDNVLKAFQKYYKTTILAKETDPNKLNDLIEEIEQFNICSETDVVAVNEKFWANAPREEIDPILDAVVENFNKQLTESDQIKCKGSLKSFCRIYPFLSAVMPISSHEWEKLYNFYLLLVKKLPPLKQENWTEGLIDAIDLDQYRSVKQQEVKFTLENKDEEIEPVPVSSKGGMAHEPDFDKLSNILEEFNAMWGGIEWKHPEKALQQISALPERLASSDSFLNAAQNADRDTAELECNNQLLMIVSSLLDENTEFARNYFDNPNFQTFVNQRVFNIAYSGIR